MKDALANMRSFVGKMCSVPPAVVIKIAPEIRQQAIAQADALTVGGAGAR